jgi:hypothetical protein
MQIGCKHLCYLASSCQVHAGAEIGGLEGSHLVALAVCFLQGQVNLVSVSDNNNDSDRSIDHYPSGLISFFPAYP